MSGSIEAAVERVRASNVRYRELIESGAVLSSTAVRTCPSCGEPGVWLYASARGLYVTHCYQCTDKECAQRWITAEFPMADSADSVDLSATEACMSFLRKAIKSLEEEQLAQRAAARTAAEKIQQERARMLREVTVIRNRLTDDQIRQTCREMIAQGLKPSFVELRAELGRRFKRVGWRKQVYTIWQEALTEVGLPDSS